MDVGNHQPWAPDPRPGRFGFLTEPDFTETFSDPRPGRFGVFA